MESLNTTPQTIELDPSCSGQAHSNRLATGPGYENMNPGCILCAPFIIRSLRSPDAVKIVYLIPRYWHKRAFRS